MSENQVEVLFKDGNKKIFTIQNEMNSDNLPFLYEQDSFLSTKDFISIFKYIEREQPDVEHVVDEDRIQSPEIVTTIKLEQILSSLEIADLLATIETAAGEPAHTSNNSSQGGHFNSRTDDAQLLGIDRLDPLGPTALTYSGSNRTLQDDQKDSRPNALTSNIDIHESFAIKDDQVFGRITVDFGVDALGQIDGNGQFKVEGQAENGVLSSNGIPITILFEKNEYIGRAGDKDVFSLSLQKDGAYTFSLIQPIDHPGENISSDVITLTFGVTITDNDGDVGTTSIRIHIQDDVPIAVVDSAESNAIDTISGNFLDNDNGGADGISHIQSVLFDSMKIDFTSTSPVIINASHGILIVTSDGSYTYTPNLSLGTDNTGEDRFGYIMMDKDGDTSVIDPNSPNAVVISVVDTKPRIEKTDLLIDETELRPALSDKTNTSEFKTIILTGRIDHDYREDGQGDGYIRGDGIFIADGSVPIDPITGDYVLTSGGVPVSVRYDVDTQTYIGEAGSTTVFRLKIDTTGSYTFRYIQNLDHADQNNHNDTITLHFGVMADDRDQDISLNEISITIADDGPIAVSENQTTNAVDSLSGNFMGNDYGGVDGLNTLTDIFYNRISYSIPQDGSPLFIHAAFGILSVTADGSYTYTPYPSSEKDNTGIDRFGYTVTDRDHDHDTILDSDINAITFSVIDSVPELGSIDLFDIDVSHIPDPFGSDVQFVSSTQIDETNAAYGDREVTGTYAYTYGGDGVQNISGNGLFTSSGSLKSNQLTSNNIPITVIQDGDQYIGRAGSTTVFTMDLSIDGTYRFNLLAGIDHMDTSAHNDVITLYFGVHITDRDGDYDDGYITIDIQDDIPIANGESLTSGAASSITGNIVTAIRLEDKTDVQGMDTFERVTSITFDGVDHSVSDPGFTDILGRFGKLSIASNGNYIYSPYPSIDTDNSGEDLFTYTIIDRDGDSSSTNLTVSIIDGVPNISNITLNADETSLRSVTSTYTVDYGTDGAKSIDLILNSFIASGSLKNDKLTSSGYDVTILQSGDTLIGRANNKDIFTIDISKDGEIRFNLIHQLDHADNGNTDETIELKFDIRITDADGDTDTATVSINVRDDAPIARADSDTGTVLEVQTGNLITQNDTIGFDQLGARVNSVSGVEYINSSSVQIIGSYGTLIVQSNGAYSYTPDRTKLSAGQMVTDIFNYILIDGDGDKSNSTLSITVLDTQPTINNTTITLDETSSLTRISSGSIVHDYKADGAGSISVSYVGVDGSTLLKSGGVNVTIVKDGNTLRGTAESNTVFTLVVNNNGSYTFNLLRAIDQPVAGSQDETTKLNFETSITDADGDVSKSIFAVNIQDDGPIANNDTFSTTFTYTISFSGETSLENTFSGSVLGNDSFGFDGGKVVSGNIQGKNGVLSLSENGSFTYTYTGWFVWPFFRSQSSGQEEFHYKIVDKDGDESTAKINISYRTTVKDLSPPPASDPLVIDINGDGVNLFALEDGVLFDLTSDGVLDQTGWISEGDAFLIHDLNGDGVVNNGTELFGSNTEEGFTELSVYDINKDGIISQSEAGDLRLWIDIDTNGISDLTELFTFEDKGLIHITLDPTTVSYEIAGHGVYYESKATLQDSGSVDVLDVFFSYLDGTTLTQDAINDFLVESGALETTVNNNTYSVDAAAAIAAVGLTTAPEQE